MIHDEKTTELELPWLKQEQTKISTTAATISRRVAQGEQEKEAALKRWVQDLDMNSAWVLRLLAVIAILLLSMLIL